MARLIAGLTILVLLNACNTKTDYEAVMKNPILYSKTVSNLTEVITYDIFNPPVASRIYAYSHLAAYEVIAHNSKNYTSLKGQLNGYDASPAPDSTKKINPEFAALTAFMEVGRTLTFSKDKTDAITDTLNMLAKDNGMPDDVFENSVAYGVAVAKSVIDWSKKDKYAETRSAPKYTVNNNDEGKWVPTPPAYFSAVEPKWMTIRTIVMDSSNMFRPVPPPPFNKDSTSKFYKMVHEVYEIGNAAQEQHVATADFWDCNGFKMNVVGHVMYATKAMTPGGHWMGITGIMCKNAKADFNETVYTYTAVAFGIMDGFIACWDAKYHWSLIRPETYINLYIDNNWKPRLQTPPFPEYTSGHSVISSAASTVLTQIYGDNQAFVDSTERPWGWPDRKFKSAIDAANEASLSRLYGGIHYRLAVEEGIKQGTNIANYLFTKLEMKKGQKLATLSQDSAIKHNQN
ncbi:MAG: phosphatase PAP2 family protein [Chitinophagaceae bacterium]|nr:MAG: phosphatase PAP2 family protein [Chitinophagaceae bacterium]